MKSQLAVTELEAYFHFPYIFMVCLISMGMTKLYHLLWNFTTFSETSN